MNLDLLRRLSEASGVSGREERIRDIVRAELAPMGLEVREDALGNLIAFKDGSGSRRVMIAAHMDEIGFYVKHVDDRGFLRVQQLGGFDTRNLFARNVIVWGREGDLPGILNPAGKPIHTASPEERKKVPDIRDLVVDLGLPAEEVKRLVRVGDPVTLTQDFREVGQYLVGKCLDDRASVYWLLETLRAMRDVPHYDDVYAVFTVQEEVGVRGAAASAFGIEPDLAIALDLTLAVDTPGVGPDEAVTVTGQGVGLKVMDSSSISTRWLLDEFVACAERNGIPHQLEILPLGGTDAAPIQRSRAGIPVMTLSLPARYVHTIQESVHRHDLEAGVSLLTAWLSGK